QLDEIGGFLEELARKNSGDPIPHQVLNARYHEQEAHIIAQAGVPGTVTIATNMAGRGTDIQLGGNAKYQLRDWLREQVKPNGSAETQAGPDESLVLWIDDRLRDGDEWIDTRLNERIRGEMAKWQEAEAAAGRQPTPKDIRRKREEIGDPTRKA